jgi:nitrogen-specific signal transduction histidine kinase
MKMGTPFLAVPISASIAADGTLLSADAPVWRLHVLAGGEADGAMAVPGLAELARTAMRTRMRLERPVRAVDDESDVELWVEVVPQEGFADLVITGWRQIASQDFAPRHQEGVGNSAAAEPASDHIMIDPELRVVRLPAVLTAKLSEHAIGSHLGSIFVVHGNADGAIPLVDKLVERHEIVDETVSLVEGESRYRISLAPVLGQDGTYLGHGGTLEEIVAENGSESLQQPPSLDLPLGRQLASVLKLPLSRIVANAETIGARLHGPLRENYADYAQDIANAARHLSDLVSDMEDLEAIDRPGFSVARDRVELGDIARRVAGLLALKAADHGISLVLPGESEKVEGIGEFRRVLQIMLNLVGNAIRYAPDGSTITITAERQADFVAISVADQGQGVPPDDRERVFEKFERLGRSGDGGSGLGLYISRRLARAMGGELSVESAPGGGALFQLSLPAR